MSDLLEDPLADPLDDLTELLHAQRAAWWALADGVKDAVQSYEESGIIFRRAARMVQDGLGQPQAWVSDMVRYALLFDLPHRYPHIDQTIYKVALSAPDPVEAIEMAERNDFNAAELREWVNEQTGITILPTTKVQVTAAMQWRSDEDFLRLIPTATVPPVLSGVQGGALLEVRAELFAVDWASTPLAQAADPPPDEADQLPLL